MSNSPPVVVIESSDSSCKVGWSVNRLPSVDLKPYQDENQITDILKPGGWSCKSNYKNITSDCHNVREDWDRDMLWQQATTSFFGSSPTTSDVLLYDTQIHSEKARIAAGEIFFETLNVPKLQFASEEAAFLGALNNIKFSRISSQNVKQQSSPDAKDAQIFSSTDSFSGLVVNSDYDCIRLRPYFSGFSPSSFAVQVPIGDRLAIGLLYSKLHRNATLCTPTHRHNNYEINECRNSFPKIHHQCCWKLARLLYEKMSFVSLDIEMDSWLIQKKCAECVEPVPPASDISGPEYSNSSLINNSTLLPQHSTFTKLNKNPLEVIASVLPYWTPCNLKPINFSFKKTRNGEDPNESSKSECCICSSLARLSNKPASLSQRPDTALNPSQEFFENVMADPLTLSTRKDWKSLLSNHPSTENTIQNIMREFQFLSTEIFFQPASILSSLHSSDDNDLSLSNWDAFTRKWNPNGLSHAALNVFDSSPIDLRRQMYANVVVLGNISTLPFFPHRLLTEIQTGLYSRLKKSSGAYCSAAESLSKIIVNVWAPVDSLEGRYASWIGAKHVLNTKPSNAHWITKEEFEEKGYL